MTSELALLLSGQPDASFAGKLSDLDPARPTLFIDGVAQPVIRNGADVVAGASLPTATRAALAQALDAWLATGRIGSPPFPVETSIADARIMALRLASIRPSRPPRAVPPGTPYRTAQPMQKSDNTPPQAVRDACKRGLELAPEHGGPGLTEGAKDRARSMANGDAVSDDTRARMRSYFARHGSYDKQSSPPSPGYVAWQLWGGDAGKRWANANTPTSDEAAKSCHTREYHTGKFGPKKAEKAGAPKWKRDGLIGPGGAWATAKRKAKEKGKDIAYAKKIYANMTGHG